MKPIQNLDLAYNKNTLIKQISRYGQIFNLNEYKFDYNPAKKVLFNWQLEAINFQAHERFGVTIAPCGSGKTLVLQTLAAIDATRNFGRKQVILVSEESHAGNFTKACDLHFKLDRRNRKVSWGAPENFTEEAFSESKTKEAKRWLLGNNSINREDFVKGSVAIMTHALFNKVFKSCSLKEKNEICKKLTILVDESHHLKGLDPEQNHEMTQLSSAINFAINNAEKFDCKVFLCTATFFRGDYALILSPKNKNRFKVYQLDFVRHFLSIGIDNFEIVHFFYDADPIDQICENIKKSLRKNKNEKQYVVVPPNNSNWRGNWRILDPDISILKRKIIKALMETKGYTREVAEKRILDLVEKSTQKVNKNKLHEEPKFGDSIESSKYDIVITCRLGREGTDWPPCSCVHNASPEKSPTFAVQTTCRLMRSYPGKKNVTCYYYVKNFAYFEEGSTKEELIADRVHCLILTMLMDEHLRPIMLPVGNSKSKKSNSKNKVKTDNYVSMRDVFGENWESVKEEIVKSLALRPVTEENVDNLTDRLLAKYDYSDLVGEQNIKDGIKVFVLKAKNPKFRKEFIDVSFIRKNNFNKLSRGENESLFYSMEKSDWKIFAVLKQDALAEEDMNRLCKLIPPVKAKELNKPTHSLTPRERHASLKDLYDFRDACLKLEKQKKSKTIKSISKVLNTSPDIIKLRIEGYNAIFRKLGKETIKIDRSRAA